MRRILATLALLGALLPLPAQAANRVAAYDVVLQNAAAATGNGTVMDMGGLVGMSVQVTGTFVASLVIEGSLDDVNFSAVQCADQTSSAVVTTVTAPALLWCPGAGLDQMRARIASYTSGNVTALGKGVLNDGALSVSPGGNTNLSATLLASAARANAAANSADQTNLVGRGVRVSIDVTAVSTSPSFTCSVQTKDSVSGVYTAVLTSAAITATGHTELRVYPGIAVTANVTANDVLARTWRVACTASGSGSSATYSVASDTLL